MKKENINIKTPVNSQFICQWCGTEFNLWSSAYLLVHPCKDGKWNECKDEPIKEQYEKNKNTKKS